MGVALDVHFLPSFCILVEILLPGLRASVGQDHQMMSVFLLHQGALSALVCTLYHSSRAHESFKIGLIVTGHS